MFFLFFFVLFAVLLFCGVVFFLSFYCCAVLRSNLSLLNEFFKIEKHTKINTKKELVEPCVKHIEDEVTVIREKTDNMLMIKISNLMKKH